ncbi:hypothetical protein MPER_09431, partial [Moniliophthora perniciosa FA553]
MSLLNTHRTLNNVLPLRMLPSGPAGGLVRRLSGGANEYQHDAGSYEMRVRSPPLSSNSHSDSTHNHPQSLSYHGHAERSASAASAMSYATANEEIWDGYYPDEDASRYSHIDDRRASAMSWQGGRA